MASFFEKAKHKAQEAAQAAQSYAEQRKQGTSAGGAAAAGGSGGAHGSNPAASGAEGSKPLSTTYTSSLPHMLRQGLTNFDPRLQSNRSFYQYNNAAKAVSIDHDAVSRETHSLARATYNYGQDHIGSNRLDGVGDDAIVDM